MVNKGNAQPGVYSATYSGVSYSFLQIEQNRCSTPRIPTYCHPTASGWELISFGERGWPQSSGLAERRIIILRIRIFFAIGPVAN